MAPILRVKARWTGFSGAPGYSVFHFADFTAPDATGPEQAEAQSAADRVAAFYEAITQFLPNPLRITVEPDLEVIESTTGELQELIGITAPATVQGSAVNTVPWAGPVGAVVNWRTSLVHRGRRIRGRTFLVPLLSSAFEMDGTLTPTARDTIQARATTLAATTEAPDLGVWARPSAVGAADGQWAAVTGVTVPDLAAVLRSRRD